MATASVQITAQARRELGTRANQRLRDRGLLPGVVYGHKEAVVPVTLPKKEVVTHLGHGAHLFDLALDGKTEKVLVKEVQYNHLGNDVIHVDFARVSLDERVTVTVSIEARGEPKGAADGGVLQQVMNEIEVECLVTDIPDVIRVSVADMKLDDVMHVRDLPLPPGVKPLADADQIVLQVKAITDEAAPTDAADGGAEPEVIGRKAEDDAAAAGGEEKK